MEKDKLQLYLEQLQNERQKIRKELLVTVDMTDYKEKISEYSYEQLQKEMQIIRDKKSDLTWSYNQSTAVHNFVSVCKWVSINQSIF